MPEDSDLLRRVADALKTDVHRVVVAAVSGGRDSMVLLHLLVSLRREVDFPLRVCHVHHGLRGEEADRDAEFVHRQALRYGIPFILERVDVIGRLLERGGSEEAVARELRYEALRRAADAFGSCVILTAHHQGDQAETVLSRFLRGSGLRGLRGMDARRPLGSHHLVRPLLDVSPQQMNRYADGYNLQFVDDSTNRLLHYQRNRIRHELIPYLERYFNAEIMRTLSHLADIVRDEDDMQNRLAEDWLGDGSVFRAPGLAVCRRTEFAVLPDALQRRVLKLVLERLAAHLDWDFAHIEQIKRIASDRRSGHAELRAAVAASAAGDYLVLRDISRRPGTDGPWRAAVLERQGCVCVDAVGWRFCAALDVPPAPGRWSRSKWTAWFPPHIGGRAAIRPARAGERVHPGGMCGTRLVSDILADGKVPRAFRPLYPVLEFEGEIVWIPGLCRCAGQWIEPGAKAGWRVAVDAPPFNER